MSHTPYVGIEFKNSPDTSAPITATNLNKLLVGLDTIHTEVENYKNYVEPADNAVGCEGITFGYNSKFDFPGYFRPGDNMLRPFVKQILKLTNDTTSLYAYGFDRTIETDTSGNTYEVINISSLPIFTTLTKDNFVFTGVSFSGTIKGGKTFDTNFGKSYDATTGKFKYLKQSGDFFLRSVKFDLIIE